MKNNSLIWCLLIGIVFIGVVVCTFIPNKSGLSGDRPDCGYGYYWDGRNCVPEPTPSCPWGQHWDPILRRCV